jgi:hypothetical protein
LDRSGGLFVTSSPGDLVVCRHLDAAVGIVARVVSDHFAAAYHFVSSHLGVDAITAAMSFPMVCAILSTVFSGIFSTAGMCSPFRGMWSPYTL